MKAFWLMGIVLSMALGGCGHPRNKGPHMLATVEASLRDWLAQRCSYPEDTLFQEVIRTIGRAENAGDPWAEFAASVQASAIYPQLNNYFPILPRQYEPAKQLAQLHADWLDALEDSKAVLQSRLAHMPSFEGKVETTDQPWRFKISYFASEAGGSQDIHRIVRRCELGLYETADARDFLDEFQCMRKRLLAHDSTAGDLFDYFERTIADVRPDAPVPVGGMNAGFQSGFGEATAENRHRLDKLFAREDLRNCLLIVSKIAWEPMNDVEPPTGGGSEAKYYRLHCLMVHDRLPAMDGSDIGEAHAELDFLGNPCVSFKMTPDAATVWARLTKENIGRQIAIVVDGEVLSAPTVQSEITGGACQISGNFSKPEAELLAASLQSGSLPCPMVVRGLEQIAD